MGNRKVPWNFTYIDETGKRKQQKGFTDKASTEKLAMKLEEDARLVRDGLMQAEPQPEQRIPTFQLEQYIKHLSQRDVSKTQLVNLELRVKKVTPLIQLVAPAFDVIVAGRPIVSNP